MLLIYFIAVLFTGYAGLITWFWVNWSRLKPFKEGKKGNVHISVVIAARNEERNIGRLLDSLKAQSYPPEFFEVIVVNDDSTDDTASVVKSYPNVMLLNAPTDEVTTAHKKSALTAGIDAAAGELIVTTDADCVAPRQWLALLASFYEENDPVAIAAPVALESRGTLLHLFQEMDFMILQGITGASSRNGSLFMANGANLAYRKESFKKVEGFRGIDKLPTGDDMMLLHKLSKNFRGRLGYLYSRQAVISTPAVSSLNEFVQQRLRWASKSMHYQDNRLLPILLLVYLVNLSFFVLLAAALFDQWYWWTLATLLILKTLIELPFFYAVTRFFNRSSAVKWFFFMQPLHIIYTVVIGLASQIAGYSWKGRKVK